MAKFTTTTISNYNQSPPPDDGSTGDDNLIKWSGIKTKLSDPTKNYIDSIQNNVKTAFGNLYVNIEEHSSDLETAVNAIGASKTTLVIKSSTTISNDVTVPSNITLMFLHGGDLTVSATKTVTINGGIEAGNYQIFTGSGNVSINAGADINIKWFGAVGDGSTDDTSAVRKWIRSGITSSKFNQISLTAPGGFYRITENGVFSDINANSKIGMKITGGGMYSTVFFIDPPATTDIWFYDNGSNARVQFVNYIDCGFWGTTDYSSLGYGDISDYANGFKVTSNVAQGSHEQGHRFTRCSFHALDVLHHAAGDNTASENKYIGCRIHKIKSTVLKTTNLQAFNTEYHGTDIELAYGDVFEVSGNGGGAIKMFGGSLIMDSSAGADKWFFKGAVATGLNAYPFVFNGVRFELRGDTTNLVSLTDAQQFELNFNSCYFLDTGSSDKASFCSIAGYSTVNFNECTFKEQGAGRVKFTSNASVKYGENGTINFNSCGIPVDWSDNCSIPNGFGAIRAINCHGSNVGSPTAGEHWAHDFDLLSEESAGDYTGWLTSGASVKSGGSPSNASLRLKTCQIKLQDDWWPATTEHKLRLPKYAVIRNIHLRKPAGGTDTTSTIFRVGRDDKSGTDHLVSNTDQFKNSHTGDATNLFYCVGATDNERNIRLYTDEAPAQNIKGGLCIVEYY